MLPLPFLPRITLTFLGAFTLVTLLYLLLFPVAEAKSVWRPPVGAATIITICSTCTHPYDGALETPGLDDIPGPKDELYTQEVEQVLLGGSTARQDEHSRSSRVVLGYAQVILTGVVGVSKYTIWGLFVVTGWIIKPAIVVIGVVYRTFVLAPYEWTASVVSRWLEKYYHGLLFLFYASVLGSLFGGSTFLLVTRLNEYFFPPYPPQLPPPTTIHPLFAATTTRPKSSGSDTSSETIVPRPRLVKKDPGDIPASPVIQTRFSFDTPQDTIYEDEGSEEEDTMVVMESSGSTGFRVPGYAGGVRPVWRGKEKMGG
jgi:hypothetical protein